ncbi:MAG: permease-like cell division protein FtsX [Syntrophomonadaceae bacterium]|nr:permease-like cell division protein FtsX [Syntrophomonadaceae bacterium]
MKTKNAAYFLQEAMTSLTRNRLLSIATVSTMAICILFLGVAVLMTINAGSFMNRLESDIEIIAYLDNSFSSDQVSNVEDKIKKLDGVDSVVFVPKDEALARMEEKFAEKDYDLGKTLGKNPLPDSFEVKAKNPQDVALVAQHVNAIPGVYKVNYGQGVVERLFQVTKWVRIISIGFVVVLAIGAVFLIATAIRLAIFARRKEIYLMKLIGATDWFVRWPFFIEGILLGMVGAVVSISLLAIGYKSLVSNLQNALFFIPMVYQPSVLLTVYLSLLATGVLLGVLGSYISLNRFLKV